MIDSQWLVLGWLVYAASAGMILLAAQLTNRWLAQPADRVTVTTWTFTSLICVLALMLCLPISGWRVIVPESLTTASKGQVIQSAPLATTLRKEESSPSKQTPKSTFNRSAVPRVDQVAEAGHSGSVQAAANVPPGRFSDTATDKPIPMENSTASTANISTEDIWNAAAVALVAVHLLVATCLLLRWLLATIAWRRLVLNSQPINGTAQQQWQAILEELDSSPLPGSLFPGSLTSVQIRESNQVTSPVLFGFMRSTILLPPFLRDASPSVTAHALRHELAHLRNHDLQRLLIFQIAKLLLWYQPSFWQLGKQLQMDQDLVADRFASHNGVDSVEYCQSLLTVAGQQQLPIPGGMAFANDQSRLGERIRTLLNPPYAVHETTSKSLRAIVIATLAIFTLVLGTLRLAPAQDKTVSQDATTVRAQTASENPRTVATRAEPSSIQTADHQLATVSGTLRDSHGNPIPNGRLFHPVSFHPAVTDETTTNADGSFTLNYRPNALRHYPEEIWAYAPEHTIARSVIKSSLETPETRLELALSPQKSAPFRVTDPSGNPISGVRVEPHHYRTPRGGQIVPKPLGEMLTGTTDENGTVLLEGLDPELLSSVNLYSEPFGHQRISPELIASRPPFTELKLGNVGAIRGKLSGAPLEYLRNVSLQFKTYSAGLTGGGQAEVVTDDQGNFFIPKIAAGPLRYYDSLSADTPYLLDTTVHKNVSAGEILELEIPVLKSVPVSGRVVDESTSLPLVGVSVYLDNDSVATNQEGYFDARVRSGNLSITVRERGYESYRTEFQLQPSASQIDLDTIRMQPIVWLEGTLVDENMQPLKDQSISSNNHWTTTDKQGRFRLPRRSDGKLIFGIPDGLGFSASQESATLVQEDPLKVQFIPVAKQQENDPVRQAKDDVVITGRIFHRGKPASNMRVYYKRGTAGFRDGELIQFLPAFTDDDGNFRLSGYKAKDLFEITLAPNVAAADPYWDSNVKQIPSTESGEYRLPDFHLLDLNQSLAGRVVDSKGNPQKDVSVSARLPGSRENLAHAFNTQSRPWTKTDANGNFRLSELPDTDLQLSIRTSTGRGLFPWTVDKNQQDIEIIVP